MKWTTLVSLVTTVLVIGLNGCAGSFDRVRPQAIQPETTDLSTLQDTLSMLVLNIKRQKPGLKLRGFVARNLDTQELYSFPFYDNVIMKSRLLQHTVSGDYLQHVIFLDLPPATYQITQMTLFNYQSGFVSGSTSTYLSYDLIRPVKFQVLPGKPTDLGQLNVEILRATVAAEAPNFYQEALNDPVLYDVTPSMTKAYLTTMSGTIKQLRGILKFATPERDPRVLIRTRGRYPSLKNVEFQQGRTWVGR